MSWSRQPFTESKRVAFTINTLAYSQDTSISRDKVLYVGPSNTFATKDQWSLGRTAPKATTTFRGIARAEVKRTKTVTLDDGTKADAIVTTNFSFPVGMSQADADALRDDQGDFLLSTDAGNLAWKHDISV